MRVRVGRDDLERHFREAPGEHVAPNQRQAKGLFTRSAAGAPHAQRANGLRGEAREHLAGERVEDHAVSKEAGDRDVTEAVERAPLFGMLREVARVVAEATQAELDEPARQPLAHLMANACVRARVETEPRHRPGEKRPTIQTPARSGSGWAQLGAPVRGVRRREMTDPSEHAARPNPEARRDDEPENPTQEVTVVDLTDARNNQREHCREAGLAHELHT
jgi:hypothetical protein